MHRETGIAPVQRLRTERRHLHVMPTDPHEIALGEERLVDDDQTIRFGSVRYSPDGHHGGKVWCLVGEEPVVVGRTPAGLAEIARHELSTPGNPRIADERYPHHLGGHLPPPPKIAEPAFEINGLLGERAFCLPATSSARQW